MKNSRRWFLFDAPASGTRLEHWLHILSGRGEGLLIRSGAGLNPLLLAAPIHAAGFRFGLSLHLRDQNIVAQASVLQSALWLNIQLIFVGDPPPSPTVKPVGPSHIPNFITFARSMSGDSIRYGVFNCLEHPRDEELLKANLDAGASVVALPDHAMQRYSRPGLEAWNWHRICPSAPTPLPHSPSGPIPSTESSGNNATKAHTAAIQLLDFTQFPEPAIETALKDWHERHGH